MDDTLLIEQLSERIKELEEIVEGYRTRWSNNEKTLDIFERVGKLEEGINKHRDNRLGVLKIFDETVVKRYLSQNDKELYKLVSK